MHKKVIVFSTHDYGGAGESAFRITQAIQKLNFETKLIVKHKSKSDSLVLQVNGPVQSISLTERVLRKFSNTFNNKQEEELLLDKNYCFFNINEAYVPVNASSLIDALPYTPDIILLAWVTDFINTETALELQKKTGAKVYWIMTDMAPITGGCHYAWDCKGYTNDCSNCPAILTKSYKDRAKQNLAIKKKNIEAGNIEVIAGSGWTLNQAKISTLFKDQEKILTLNGLIDFSIFNDANRNIAKQVFNIPKGKKVVFSGATYTGEKRKGITYLVESLKELYNLQTEKGRKQIVILVAGSQLEENEYVKQIPFDIVPIEFIKDERLLALAYQAADVFICPSVEDSGPMMVNEALACGTPVVGFEMGLLYNMVENGVNGFKVPLGDALALGSAINKIISLPGAEFQLYSNNSIKMVEEYASLKALEKLISQLANDISFS